MEAHFTCEAVTWRLTSPALAQPPSSAPAPAGGSTLTRISVILTRIEPRAPGRAGPSRVGMCNPRPEHVPGPRPGRGMDPTQ